MLKIQAIGNLGSDAEIKNFGGKDFVVFDIAHNEKYKNKEGVAVSRTVWVSCILDRTNVAQYLKKGTQVYVDGIPKSRAWKDQQGNPQSGISLNVRSLELLGSANGNGGQQQQQTNGGYKPPVSQQQQQTPEPSPSFSNSGGDEDDLPF